MPAFIPKATAIVLIVLHQAVVQKAPFMREILYIQAGSLSNHIGTHFWNTQQEYFTYDDDEPVIVDHDVSFRQGISPRVRLFTIQLATIPDPDLMDVSP